VTDGALRREEGLAAAAELGEHGGMAKRTNKASDDGVSHLFENPDVFAVSGKFVVYNVNIDPPYGSPAAASVPHMTATAELRAERAFFAEAIRATHELNPCSPADVARWRQKIWAGTKRPESLRRVQRGAAPPTLFQLTASRDIVFMIGQAVQTGDEEKLETLANMYRLMESRAQQYVFSLEIIEAALTRLEQPLSPDDLAFFQPASADGVALDQERRRMFANGLVELLGMALPDFTQLAVPDVEPLLQRARMDTRNPRQFGPRLLLVKLAKLCGAFGFRSTDSDRKLVKRIDDAVSAAGSKKATTPGGTGK
jgi:ribosomal protein L37AE/L43A